MAWSIGRAQATIRRLIALRMFYDYLAYVHEEGIDNPVITQRHYIDQGHHLPRDIRQSEIEKLFTAIGDHLAVQKHLAIRPDLDSIYLFTTQQGALHPRSLQRRLVHYSRQCGVLVTAQRLRHTFASQVLAAGMPVSSLQHYLGHEHIYTTMIYAGVSDPLLRQDYFQDITTLDPGSGNHL